MTCLACRTKVDSVGKCIVRQKGYKSQGRGVRGLARTTDGVRDSGRGETNNELRRLGSTRSKMPKVKTHSLLAVVESHERSNKVFGERFMNSIRNDCEDAIANNFLGVGVEVARYTLTCIGGENSDLNPSFCENHVRELRTFFTVVLEPNIHTFSVLSETLLDFLKSKLC